MRAQHIVHTAVGRGLRMGQASMLALRGLLPPSTSLAGHRQHAASTSQYIGPIVLSFQ
jgi:hypothetical protein